MFFFFFSSRRRHTRFSRDWSSDVCSSDLSDALPPLGALVAADPDDDSAAGELALAYADRPLERAELFLSRAARVAGEARGARLREAAGAFYDAGDEDRARAALRDAFEAWPAED